MGGAGCGGSIRSRALTGFIAEQTTLHSLQHGHSHRTSGSLAHSKGTVDDETQHGRHFADVHHQDEKGEQQIAHSHKRYHHSGEARNALYASEDDDQRHDSEYHGHTGRVVAPGRAQSVTEGVALHNLVGNAKTKGDETGKKHAHPAAVKAVLHIVGRATIEGVLALTLEQLGQRGLHEGRTGSQQGHYPHPEDSTRTTNGNCTGHTCQIACTHTATQAHGKSLERIDMAPAIALCVPEDRSRRIISRKRKNCTPRRHHVK